MRIAAEQFQLAENPNIPAFLHSDPDTISRTLCSVNVSDPARPTIRTLPSEISTRTSPEIHLRARQARANGVRGYLVNPNNNLLLVFFICRLVSSVE